MLHLLFAAALTLPKYWTVHIDTPRANVVREFEQTDVDYFSTIRDTYIEAHATPPPITIFSANGAYYGLRARTSLADLEKPSALSAEARKTLSQRTAPISERTHALLATHHNEIWETDPDLTTMTSAAAPKFARIRFDAVKPSKQKDYDDLMKRVKAACEKNGVAILALFSDYGTGENIYLFTSDAPLDLRKLFGRELLNDWRACLNTTREYDAKARPDLTATEGSAWLSQ